MGTRSLSRIAPCVWRKTRPVSKGARYCSCGLRCAQTHPAIPAANLAARAFMSLGLMGFGAGQDWTQTQWRQFLRLSVCPWASFSRASQNAARFGQLIREWRRSCSSHKPLAAPWRGFCQPRTFGQFPHQVGLAFQVHANVGDADGAGLVSAFVTISMPSRRK